ncbi:hypothetical protein EW145_g5461 [Phellinidium pouzarii]|uniref:PX domain-containing protein n=1 Tax=Phellinidium pouzarii TaxID=167371 RepID=A0A4S4KZY0_9AGAM|nr:hypothetical protein EW145_g5461 [Phellinidium pouzarii]
MDECRLSTRVSPLSTSIIGLAALCFKPTYLPSESTSTSASASSAAAASKQERAAPRVSCSQTQSVARSQKPGTMQIFTVQFSGTEGGPPSTQAYKRAVYKQPPRHFAVHVLLPQKHGNAYSYGMRITPLRDHTDRHSIASRTSDHSNTSSGSSSGSGSQTLASPESTVPFTSEYEIWRRWEDCLFFQDTLENQYAIMSREKRARLQAGKGVKKNGLYEHEDPLRRLHRAASFESLPPGPDPTMIAKDLHEVLPTLTKKGTIFKASKDTIEQRGNEFKALIEALLREGDDVPTLLTELRQLRVVRDFFGFWRRDQDRLMRERTKLGDSDKTSVRGRSESLGSRASSVFGSGGLGMYFNASNLSLQLPSPLTSSNSERAPRRPPIMQGGKGAMLPVSPTTSEPVQSKSMSSTTPRPRAQTIQGTTGVDYGNLNISRSVLPGSISTSSMHTIVSKPTASAPAGATFNSSMGDDGGYTSDSPSIAESTASSQALYSPGGFTRSPHMRSPHSPSDVRYKDTTMVGAVDRKGNGHAVQTDMDGPIIVSLEAGESLPFDEEAHMLIMREHEHLIPQHADSIYEPTELRVGAGRGLQDLTIQEEDEQESEQYMRDSHEGYPHSEYQHSESSAEQGIRESMMMVMEDEHLLSVLPRSSDSVGARSAPVYRNGMFFRQPSSSTEEDTVSSMDGQSILSVERPKSPDVLSSRSSTRSHTPVSSARVAAAHADALKALTGGTGQLRPQSSTSPTRLSFTSASLRSSIRTSGSGSGPMTGFSGFGPTSTSDTQSSRPDSLQSSVASCVDLDSRLSSSPVVLHAKLFDEFEFIEDVIDQNQSSRERAHESMSSVRTFMTESSVDAVIPPSHGKRSMSPPARLRLPVPAGASMTRSLSSSGSRSPNNRMSQMSGVSDAQLTEDGDDLLDSYFYGVTSPPSELEEGEDGSNGTIFPGREHFRGALARPNNFPKPFQNRPPGQFHLPWTPSRRSSPGIPDSVRSSVLTVDSSLSVPFFFSVTPSLSTRGSTSTSVSYTPSIISSHSEEGGAAAISIKVVCGEQIVAFRTDRSSELADVRAKLSHKLFDQLEVALSNHFELAYKPSVVGRVKELRAAGGRSRSSSVSSVGATDPSSLRIIFSQRDWLDAVNSCAPGAKLTLHVLNN